MTPPPFGCTLLGNPNEGDAVQRIRYRLTLWWRTMTQGPLWLRDAVWPDGHLGSCPKQVADEDEGMWCDCGLERFNSAINERMP